MPIRIRIMIIDRKKQQPIEEMTPKHEKSLNLQQQLVPKKTCSLLIHLQMLRPTVASMFQALRFLLLVSLLRWHPLTGMISFPPYSPFHDDIIDETSDLRLVRESRQVRRMESRASYAHSTLHSPTHCTL